MAARACRACFQHDGGNAHIEIALFGTNGRVKPGHGVEVMLRLKSEFAQAIPGAAKLIGAL
jgi:hypothetical protein